MQRVSRQGVSVGTGLVVVGSLFAVARKVMKPARLF
jgi:hypothetical protein